MAFQADPRKLQERSTKARNRNNSPAKLSEIASKAALMRWHSVQGSDLERVEAHLQGLETILTQALETGDIDLYIRVSGAMAVYERMRMVIRGQGGAARSVAGMGEVDETVIEGVKEFQKGRKAGDKERE